LTPTFVVKKSAGEVNLPMEWCANAVFGSAWDGCTSAKDKNWHGFWLPVLADKQTQEMLGQGIVAGGRSGKIMLDGELSDWVIRGDVTKRK
jgi:hypothetical protein